MMKYDEAYSLFGYACDVLRRRAKCYEGEISCDGALFQNHYCSVQFNVTADQFGYFLVCLCIGNGECIECNIDVHSVRGVDAFLDRCLKYFKLIHGTYQMSIMEGLRNA